MSTQDTVLAGKYIRINGITWSNMNSMSQARYGLAGCGTVDASLSFGGSGLIYDEDLEEYVEYLQYAEKFNGTSWSTTTAMTTGRKYLAGCGTQSAALAFGGDTSISPNPAAYSAVTEKFNGSAWSASGSMNLARSYLAGAGTQSAALSFGGTIGTISAVTEKFNGSAWSASGTLNNARYGLSGSGIQSAAMSFGGWTTTYSAVSEKFDGSTWNSTSSLNIPRYNSSACGTRLATSVFGGHISSGTSYSTEMFNGLAWTSDSVFNLNTARELLAGSGLNNYALSFGGTTGSSSSVTEKFQEEYPYKGKTLVTQEFSLKFVTTMRCFLVTSTGKYYNLSLDRTAMAVFQTSCGNIITSENYTNLGQTCLTFLKTFSFKRGTSTELVTFPASAETIFLNACSSYVGKYWDNFIEDFFTELFLLLTNGTAGSFNLIY